MPRDPILLTPGPLTTSERTKQAMLHDWGSRDGSFIELTARLRRRLTALAEAEAEHVCVPIAGSGTFAVEAMLGHCDKQHLMTFYDIPDFEDVIKFLGHMASKRGKLGKGGITDRNASARAVLGVSR